MPGFYFLKPLLTHSIEQSRPKSLLCHGDASHEYHTHMEYEVMLKDTVCQSCWLRSHITRLIFLCLLREWKTSSSDSFLILLSGRCSIQAKISPGVISGRLPRGRGGASRRIDRSRFGFQVSNDI